MTTLPSDVLRARHGSALSQRTAQSHAAFLLPLLRPGMALLDLGSGPGSITRGLADAVAPGPAVGVDLDADDIPGVRVARADAGRLPFPDSTFDAIFACALLQHVPDPRAVLREARRVARPGAVIALADADWGGYLLAPSDPRLVAGFDLMGRLRTGSPFVGRELRGLLAAAGFERCTAAARAMHHGTVEEVSGFAGFNASFFTNPAVAERLVAGGWATPQELNATSDAWLRWGAEPGAFYAGQWCEAVGWCPDPGVARAA